MGNEFVQTLEGMLCFIMACAAGCVMATLPLAILALDSCALTFGIKFYFREVLPRVPLRPVGTIVHL